jgi:hypothetical protein
MPGMANAPLPAEPAQTRQGGGARFFRRIGSAIAGGIQSIAGHRRPAAPKASRTPPKPRDPAAPPAPGQPRRPRPAATVPQPRQRGWFARWFGPRQRDAAQAAPDGPTTPARRRRRGRKDPLFTPETHPGLTEEDCAFLNTPLGECSPEQLQVLAEALSQQIAAVMGPGLGMDADALFATFCERLLIAPAPDAPPGDEPGPATDAAQPAGHDAPPGAPPHAQAEQPAGDAAMTAAAEASVPGVAVPADPVFRRGIPFGHSGAFDRRPPLRRSRSRSQRRAPARQRASLPARRLCYAACAGPP